MSWTLRADMVDDLGPDLRIEKRYREKLRVDTFAEAARLAAERPMTRDEINELLLKGI